MSAHPYLQHVVLGALKLRAPQRQVPQLAHELHLARDNSQCMCMCICICICICICVYIYIYIYI